jgi:hypothetical protein
MIQNYEIYVLAIVKLVLWHLQYICDFNYVSRVIHHAIFTYISSFNFYHYINSLFIFIIIIRVLLPCFWGTPSVPKCLSRLTFHVNFGQLFYLKNKVIKKIKYNMLYCIKYFKYTFDFFYNFNFLIKTNDQR